MIKRVLNDIPLTLALTQLMAILPAESVLLAKKHVSMQASLYVMVTLGLTISADMKVSEQCGIAAAKGNQILGLIRRNIVYKEKELIILLYKTIVRPHLEYCIQAWRPYLKKDIDMLERVQRRATKMIPKLRNVSYEMRLNECGLTTLETRRLRGDQIEVFKILNGYD